MNFSIQAINYVIVSSDEVNFDEIIYVLSELLYIIMFLHKHFGVSKNPNGGHYPLKNLLFLDCIRNSFCNFLNGTYLYLSTDKTRC